MEKPRLLLTELMMPYPTETPFVCIFHDFEDSPEARFEIMAPDAQEAALRAVAWWKLQIEEGNVLCGEETLRIRVHGTGGVSIWDVWGAQGSYVAQVVKSEKPRTRLVSKGRYLRNLGEKGVNYAVGSFYGLLGVPLLLLSLLCIYVCFAVRYFLDTFLCLAMVSLGLSAGAFWGCKSYFRKAREMETVTPITRDNTGLLPPEETLLRPSEFSPSHQQAELLRAAPQGSETPSEELLRVVAGAREER